MEMEAMPMMTTKKALTTRLSLCRKRIMDEPGPSALYALSGGAGLLATVAAGLLHRAWAAAWPEPERRDCRAIID
jgi:hypothetical protein